jgi:hypothetical protein
MIPAILTLCGAVVLSPVLAVLIPLLDAGEPVVEEWGFSAGVLPCDDCGKARRLVRLNIHDDNGTARHDVCGDCCDNYGGMPEDDR